jgi:Geminivirus Rep catalytic domain
MDSKIELKIHKQQKKKFLLSARKLYLTYSKYKLECKTIVTNLKEILSSYVVQNYIVVREYHEDGEPHLHVYLELLKKLSITTSNFLDGMDPLALPIQKVVAYIKPCCAAVLCSSG